MSGAVTGNPAAACTAANPTTGAAPLSVPEDDVWLEMSTSFAPAGGATCTSESDTVPNEMSLASSASAGDDAPCA